MNIVVAADHNGLELKGEIAQLLRSLGHSVLDVGPHSMDPADDYPDYAKLLAEGVSNDVASRGVMVCGSGVGASIAANKVRGIRASVCHDSYSAHQGVEHDDMNVLCSRIIGGEVARELVLAFISAQFSRAERHQRRLDKVLSMEESFNAASQIN